MCTQINTGLPRRSSSNKKNQAQHTPPHLLKPRSWPTPNRHYTRSEQVCHSNARYCQNTHLPRSLTFRGKYNVTQKRKTQPRSIFLDPQHQNQSFKAQCPPLQSTQEPQRDHMERSAHSATRSRLRDHNTQLKSSNRAPSNPLQILATRL